MTDAVIDEVDGRMIRIGDQWLADFASCNYLGFDLDREIIAAIPEYVNKWGRTQAGRACLVTLSSTRRSRLASSSSSGENTLVLPTITLIHMSVIPVLAGDGTIFVDTRAHKTVYEGCQFAAARGATVKRFRFEDPGRPRAACSQRYGRTRLVCMDGVNSMTGNALDLLEFARVARRYDALLYVDDAHRVRHHRERATTSSPYGSRAKPSSSYSANPTTNDPRVGSFKVVLVTRRFSDVPS